MRYLFALLTAVALLMPSAAFAEDVIDHKPFDELLSTYVNKNGMVAYGQLKRNKDDYKKFKDYVAAVEGVKIDKQKHSRKARLAYYINAYNATVIKAVIEDVYPDKSSVMDVKDFFDASNHKVAGRTMSLNHLENDIIRPKFREARVHFVLVCAAKSCPKLQRTALTEDNLYKVMDSATRSFVRESTKVKGGKVHTSKIFEWFKDDFVKYSKQGSVKAFLAHYHKGKVSKTLEKKETELAFDEYDWKLNKR
jgi:hypothetical protein